MAKACKRLRCTARRRFRTSLATGLSGRVRERRITADGCGQGRGSAGIRLVDRDATYACGCFTRSASRECWCSMAQTIPCPGTARSLRF